MKKTLTFLLSPFNNSSIWSSRKKISMFSFHILIAVLCQRAQLFLHVFWVKAGRAGIHMRFANRSEAAATALWMKIIRIKGGDRSCQDVGRFQLILTIFTVLPSILSLLPKPKAQDPPPKAWQQTQTRGSCFTEAQLLTALHKLPFHCPPGWLVILSFWLCSSNSHLDRTCPHTVEL